MRQPWEADVACQLHYVLVSSVDFIGHGSKLFHLNFVFHTCMLFHAALLFYSRPSPHFSLPLPRSCAWLPVWLYCVQLYSVHCVFYTSVHCVWMYCPQLYSVQCTAVHFTKAVLWCVSYCIISLPLSCFLTAVRLVYNPFSQFGPQLELYS